jgi:hypothetical protein
MRLTIECIQLAIVADAPDVKSMLMVDAPIENGNDYERTRDRRKGQVEFVPT